MPVERVTVGWFAEDVTIPYLGVLIPQRAMASIAAGSHTSLTIDESHILELVRAALERQSRVSVLQVGLQLDINGGSQLDELLGVDLRQVHKAAVQQLGGDRGRARPVDTEACIVHRYHV